MHPSNSMYQIDLERSPGDTAFVHVSAGTIDEALEKFNEEQGMDWLAWELVSIRKDIHYEIV